MPNYKYKGWDERQQIVRDVILAPDEVTAAERIRMKRITPVTIEAVKSKPERLTSAKKMKNQELVSFCGHLALMLKAGVNIVHSLEILEDQATNGAIRKIIRKILENVGKGESLSTALEVTGEFPQLLIDMVKVGETSGELDGVLFNMEEYYQKEMVMRSKVKTALVYPKILIFATLGTLVFFFFFVIPTFQDMFSTMTDLPLATRILLGVSAYVKNHALGLGGVIAALVLLYVVLRQQEEFLLLEDRILLKIPLVGRLKKQVIIGRMARSLGVFLHSGVPVLGALEATKNILNSRSMEKGFEKATKSIMNGKSLTEAFEEEKLFEPMVYGLMRVGEETGALDEMLKKLAQIYDREVDFGLGKLVARLEPTLILLIGGIVGFIIIAIAVPILSMSQTIG